MLSKYTILLIIVAGIMNGSFVIPAKFISRMKNENVWLWHSLIGIGIIPWLLLLIIGPHSVTAYATIPWSLFVFLITSGFIFGIGQVGFAYAIETIGVGLSFTTNISLGVIIGSMFVVFYRGLFFSGAGFLVTIAVLLTIASLLISYFSGKQRATVTHAHTVQYKLGWLFCIFTGLTSGLQNICFVVLMTYYHSHVGASKNLFWIWPPFLTAAMFTMALGFWYRIKKEHTPTLEAPKGIKDLSSIILMGLFFTGSLALYSLGMGLLSHRTQIIGWPAFMIAIILTSQIWGWVLLRKQTHTTQINLLRLISIVLLIVGILLLSTIS